MPLPAALRSPPCRWALTLLAAAGCSAPPAGPVPAIGTLPPGTLSASVAAPPPKTALWIEGEGLAPAIDLAFSPDHAILFVKRKDESVEAWDAVKGTLLGRASRGEALGRELPESPFARPAVAAEAPGRGRHLVLRPLEGVDDEKLVAWMKTEKIRVETTPDGLALTAPPGAELEMSPDARMILIWREEKGVEIAHRVAHTHFAVKGWNLGFSSQYGYAGDHTTWPGDVSASFGPLADQLALQSTARRGANLSFAATRLYDPRRGKVIADLAKDTCQPNDLVWSPLGKYVVQSECFGAALLLSDAATGKPLPSMPGEMPVRFGAADATLASISAGSAGIRRVGTPEAMIVIPGPRAIQAAALAPDGSNVAILAADGLDVWNLVSGASTHVDSMVIKYGDLARSATGRFQGYVDDANPTGLTIVDATTGGRRLSPVPTAFHPTHDWIARQEATGIRVVDLVTGDAVGPPVPVAEGKKKITVQQLSFSPDGAWLVAALPDASLLVIDGKSHLARRIPPIDPQGCSPTPMQFAAPDTVSLSCATAVHTLSLTSGAALSPPAWKDPVEQGKELRPPFSAPAIDAVLAGLPAGTLGPPWSATKSLIVARVDPPLLGRAKDGRVVSLHAFGYGTRRAVIVVDDGGRWDANEAGAALVRVSVGGVEDAGERARRRVPGLLAAFVRGE